MIDEKEYQHEENLLREILDTEKAHQLRGRCNAFEIYSPSQNFEQF